MKDYYKILHLEKNASTLAIKKAYRTQAKKIHPDINSSKDAHCDFLDINEAYKVLNNPIKRIQYDRLYDYQILKKTKYNKKYVKWEAHVNKSAKKGQKRGANFAKEKDFKYQSKKSKWGSKILSFIFDFLIDGVLRVILEIIFFAI